LTLLLTLVLAGCAASTGGPTVSAATAPPATASSPSPTSMPSTTPTPSAVPTPPSTSPTPSVSFVVAPIGDADEAIAAVVAAAPQYAGFGPERPGQIGESSHVVIATVDAGWELTFVTGSGDCMAGCIEHSYAKYAVARTGEVRLLCEWSTDAGTVVQGRPC
jgi:hypothetical protein